MGELVAFPAANESGPYVEGPVLCVRCQHEWRAVSPAGSVTSGLECPSCRAHTGVRRGMTTPEAARWVCNCGNDLFMLTAQGAPMCCNCGLRATSWADG